MAARSTRPAKRSPRQWALRGGLAVAALALGYVSTTQTLAFAIGKSSAARAHGLAPGDGRIAAELAEQLSAGEADTDQRARADRIAHQALADEPLAAPALTALALNAQLRGNTTKARQLFAHSDALSRRELGTRLWLIEDAVARENIPGALRHYDIALRTSKVAPEILFPVMAGAAANPEIAHYLAAILAKEPAWADAFVQYLGAAGTDPAASATLFRRLAMLGYAIPQTAQTGVINALVNKEAFDKAWRYYTLIRTGSVRDRSRDPDFTAQLQSPSVFDWTPVTNDAGVTASIQQTSKGGVFYFAAPPTVGGLVLQQLQILPPGRYRLEGISMEIEQPREARPYWQLSCMDGRELGRIDMANSTEANGRFGGELIVSGNNCAAQTLRLIARSSTEVGGVAGRITRVMLVPVGPTRS